MSISTIPPARRLYGDPGRITNWKQPQRRVSGIEDGICLFQGVQKLPTLPALAVRAMQVIEDSDSSARDLATVLSQDQAASARILRVANSAFYALQRKVLTVKDAIVVLGFSSVRT